MDAVRNFARAARTVGLRRAHPWAIAGLVADDLDPRELAEAAAALERSRVVLDASPAARRLLEQIADPDEFDVLLPHLRDRSAGPVPDAAWLAQVRSPAWRAAMEQLVAEVEQFHEQHAGVLRTFALAFVEHGDAAALTSAAETAQRGVLGKRKRAERFEAAVQPLLAEGATVLPAQVPGLLMGLQAARSHAAQLTAQLEEVLGDIAPRPWTPMRSTAVATLREAVERVERCDTFARQHGELWRLIEEEGSPATDTADVLHDVAAAWARWTVLLGSGVDTRRRWADGRHWTDAWAEDAQAWTREIGDGADAPVRRWAGMVSQLDPLRTAGLDEFRDALLTVRLDAAEAEVAYLRGVATASLRERRDAGGLQGFDAALRDGEIVNYAAAAEAARGEQTVALPADLLQRRPYRGDALSGKVGELRRRLDAKRGGLSFRQLIERYGEEILQAAPCFFVSPASLAQFVPPGAVTFDLVVFDEASQVTVAQAIGALGRGRSAVIVGDSQQMPPTSVGRVKATEEEPGAEDEVEVLEDLESILTECVESGLPRVWLSWHYRSQDETLIAFSNAHYYEGRLASLPSPGGDPAAGIELRRVEGHFNREDTKHEFRTNRVEAEAIVAEVRRRLADPHRAEESIGVVTFNAQQRDLVLDLLEECGDPRVARQLREDAAEGIFVKNLENVQGDERDVILFSIAFSKRPDGGPLPMNFGPLGMAGGEKRLNVAVTRARRKVMLFVSFDATDIDLSRTNSRGITHLRSYLELAAQGPSCLPSVGVRSAIGTDHVREAIAHRLRQRGLEVACAFGLSDFSLDMAVREPGSERWQLAIVLDGKRWAERPTVADRDLTPLLLEPLMGWGACLRVWLPAWIDDPDVVLRRVDEAIEQARERQKQEDARRAAEAEKREAALADTAAEDDAGEWVDEDAESEAVEVETFIPSGSLRARADEEDDERTEELGRGGLSSHRDVDAQGAEYLEVDPVPLGTREDLGLTNSPTVRAAITAAVRETVEAEGPIAAGRLARSIGRRFGFDRVAAGRQRFILEAVPSQLLRASELGEFVWPTGVDPEQWRGYRTTPEGVERPLTDVAPEEIINAMAAVAQGRRLASDEDLFRATLGLFGQRRLTSQTTMRLQACSKIAVEDARLVRTDEGGWLAGA